MMRALLILLVLFGCTPITAYKGNNGNPLIGTWRAEVPSLIGRFNLGRCEFSEGHMRAFGADVDVDYEISGNTVRVIPRDFGPELELTMVDTNTAQLDTSLLLTVTAGLVLGDFSGLSLHKIAIAPSKSRPTHDEDQSI